jgi:hypothetical protein
MRERCSAAFSVTPVYVRNLATVAALCFLTVGCGDDEPTWTVTAVSDRASVRGNNTDELQLQISVLDDERNPAPVGSEVTVQCIDEGGQPFGSLNQDEATQLRLLIDDLGIAGTSFSCSNQTQETINTICIVNYPAESVRANLLIRCTPSDQTSN